MSLEEIKQYYSRMESLDEYTQSDIKWLIEQAERAQELEEENKRYREALEFYADERNYKERDFGMIVQPAIQDGDRGRTAREALEAIE